MDEEAALRLLLDEVIDGREGCFCLTSSRDMPAKEALKILSEQGRHREAVPLVEERDRGATFESMVGGRRLWRPPARFHRSIDDLFDTIFRLASKDRVNEVHLKFVGKFDTYHSSDGRRSETPVLLELRPSQQGHLVLFLGGNLAVSASGTMFRGGFEDVKTMCQLSKMLEKQWTNCQGQVIN